MGITAGFERRKKFGISGMTKDFVPPIPPEQPLIIEIRTAEELQAIETHPEKQNLEATFKIMNDIDCSSIADFQSITDFGATLDGQGYSIFNYNSTVNGLFASTTNIPREIRNKISAYTGIIATITDVHILGDVSTINSRVGLLIGDSMAYISNCSADGNVEASDNVGILVGVNWGEISNCYSKGNINAIEFVMGGLVGYSEGLIKYTYTIATSGNANYNANDSGLLIGMLYNEAQLENSYSIGNIDGGGDIGGISSSITSSSIINCYSTCDVTANNNAGAILGVLSGTVTNSYAYEYQLINGVPVTDATDGSATGIATYAEVSTTDWHTDVLGFDTVNWEFRDGYYPLLKSTDGVLLPNQEWIPVRSA